MQKPAGIHEEEEAAVDKAAGQKVAPSFGGGPAEYRLPTPPSNGLANSLEKKRLQAYLGMVVFDLLAITASFGIVSKIYMGTVGLLASYQPGLLFLPIYITIAAYNGSYSLKSLTDWRHASTKVVISILISSALLNFLLFFAKMNADFSRVIFVAGALVSFVVLTAFRAAFTRWLTGLWGPNAVNNLVIHAGGPRFHLPHSYHVDAEVHGLRPDIDDPDALDRLAKYLRNMDRVLISSSREHRLAWSEVLKGSGLQGEVVDQNVRDLGALGVVHHDDVNISSLTVSVGHLGIRARASKRLFDLALTSIALLLLSPVMLVVALAIKLEDRGPVIFKQRRMGRGNQFFDIYKFRSMRQADANGDRSASKDDDRITMVGRFIRRTSIDELPQLFNVLKGDMSLVGPRPHAIGSKAGNRLFWEVDRKYWQRHGLRPGITGLAQVRGYRGATENEADLAKRLMADLEYGRDWSMWLDIKILFATATVLVHERAF
ncbi:exopolysaccharide biosynthesis polyprenyl glycosylphosphotransferase [Aurantiacibacter sp. MUD11]|uniref:exopolysaccharide biosynthesis polyprenyl glycosylphosphotransferase n=1 Tax=Aurantiacibacter sp. MUD11 TaxID=3003265 RepID=UPI0022AA1A94|nr:exopolysaccharide biosynthesis polyprenyl glycosylphosphotransferase [Aurantiacibacter sp. MUD11]WAT17043.1 exopolysaccharide biosynthesis polyprenyl glycosylphosphotransferase [Aurantiacibacter sp. MUD11]